MEMAHDQPADEIYAAKIVKLLLASWPQQKPQEPEIYIPQMVARLVGVPEWILREMVNPKNALLRDCKWLPTIAEVSSFIQTKMPKLPAYKPMVPEIEYHPETVEVREAQAHRARRAAQLIRDTSRKLKVGRRMNTSLLPKDIREAIAKHIADPEVT